MSFTEYADYGAGFDVHGNRYHICQYDQVFELARVPLRFTKPRLTGTFYWLLKLAVGLSSFLI